MKDILDRIADSSANESSHEPICRLRDCAHEIEALRSALACRPDAQADERYDLLQAAVNCPHEIESNRVVLHYSDKQPGHNALAQLRERLTRAAAPQAGAAQGAPTSEVIIDAFRRAGMNLDPTPNALYTVRGQHAQLIEGVRSLLAATPQPPQPAMSEERIATIQTLMLDWVDSKPGDEAKEVWNRIEEHLRTLAEPVAPAEQPRECGEPSEDAMAMSAALRMDEDGAVPILDAIEELKTKAGIGAEAAQGVPEGWKLVPIKPTAWRPGSETPPVKEGKAQEFILAVDDE